MEKFEKDVNKKKAAAAIWGNPDRVFGCQFKQSGKYLANARGGEFTEAGKIRLIPHGEPVEQITVIWNGDSRPEKTDIFTYLENYVLKTRGFGDTLAELSKIYGFSLEYSAEEQTKIKRQQLAAELCQTFITALGENPDGPTAQYLKQRGLTPDGVHFGELTDATINRAVEALKNRGISFEPDDLTQLKATAQIANNGYNLVIPYYHNGKIIGIKYRDITGTRQANKYQNNNGLIVAGYCDRLTFGEPAILCEGELDSIRLTAAGLTNVIALGGQGINENVAELLRRNNINQITYVPDVEFGPDGERLTGTIAGVIKSAQEKKTTTGEPQITHFYISELPTPDDMLTGKYAVYKDDGTIKKYKTDADTYGKDNGPEALKTAVEYATSWWEWELSGLIEWAKREDKTNGGVAFSKMETRFREIYNRCNSPFERARIKQAVKGNAIYKAFGITPEALDDYDADRRNLKYNETIKTGVTKLQQAVEVNATPETIAAIVADLNTAQGANTREEWDKQLNESWDDELEAIRNQPDALTTKWELGNINKQGQFIHYENIEFYPADITVFCAATSHGKTCILFQSAIDLVRRNDGKIYLYVSCEENKRQLVERAINTFIDIPDTENGQYQGGTFNGRTVTKYGFFNGTRKRTIKAIIRGTNPPAKYMGNFAPNDHYNALAADVRAQLDKYRDTVRERLKLIHTDNTAEAIAANIKYYVAKYENDGYQVGGVFVDYMQLLTSDKKTFSRTDELKDVCKSLRIVAAEIEQPVIIAAQLNREAIRDGIDGVTVANIGEGADVERVAHDVFFIWQTGKTKADKYYKTTKDGVKKWDYSEAGDRANRIFCKPTEIHPDERELKDNYLYIEQLKARDGKTGGWGLFPFDGERGTVGENDIDAMKK